MAVKNIVKPITLLSIDSSTFTGSYQVLTAGLSHDVFLLHFLNDSNRLVTFSLNGTTDHGIVRTASDYQLNFQQNAQPLNYVALLAKGTPIYVKGTAGTGLFYAEAWYQPYYNE